MGKLSMLALASLLAAGSAAAAGPGDWPEYGNDPGGMKYSPLSQITPANVAGLQPAWEFHYNVDGAAVQTGPGRNWSVTPIVVDGVMYLQTPSPVNSIVALDATSGALLWKWGLAGGVPGRGLAYWPGDRRTGARLIFGAGSQIFALDADTGHPSAGFGIDGRVQIDPNLPIDRRTRVPNPIAIFENIAITGAITGEGGPPGPSGDIRGWDVRSGKEIWRFHTIPHPGEPGFWTWPSAESVRDRPGANVWSMFTVDAKRGMVFAPTGSPGYDFYGADRAGANLYGNSLVALDARTGKRRWHFQMVPHDLLDHDGTGAPSLIEVRRKGRTIPAVAQSTKTGFLFILDRLTGQPIYGVEDRAIPKSKTPGEVSWPTIPTPLKPPPLARTGMTRNDLTNLSLASREFCAKELEKFGGSSDFLRPIGVEPTLTFPGTNGGSDWGGVSYSPKLGYIFANITNVGTSGILQPRTVEGQTTYRNEGAFARFVDQDRYPCQVGPWGELAAINANTGDIVWKVPLGSYKPLEERGIPNSGAPNLGGSLTTASGLVFIGATNDRRFRAFDGRSGKEIWRVDMKGSGNATPMSFRGKDGKQYVVITSSGPGNWRNVGPVSSDSNDAVIAYALP